ncbi:hypothetical protein PanWU01x14_047620, partial [Parasponia andersonii]
LIRISSRQSTYEQDQSSALIRIDLDLLEERREQSQLQIVSYHQCTARCLKPKVGRRFVGKLVLRQDLVLWNS